MSVSQRPRPRTGYRTIEVVGYQVNTRYYTDNGQILDCAVLLGPEMPGIRLKDSVEAKHERKRVRVLVAGELKLPLYCVDAAARYTGGDLPTPVTNIEKFGLARRKQDYKPGRTKKTVIEKFGKPIDPAPALKKKTGLGVANLLAGAVAWFGASGLPMRAIDTVNPDIDAVTPIGDENA